MAEGVPLKKGSLSLAGIPERWISTPPRRGLVPYGAGPPITGLASLRYLQGGHFVKKNIFFYKKKPSPPFAGGGHNMGWANFLLIYY